MCCCPELKAMMGTIDTMNKTMDSVKLITDETQYVVGEVKGFVGGIKTKCEDLETVLVDDVKSVIGKSLCIRSLSCSKRYVALL